MESRNRLLLLGAVLHRRLLLPAARRCAARKSSSSRPRNRPRPKKPPRTPTATPPRVIEPNVARRKIKTPKIDNENWEVGAGFGFLSIEDFGTNPAYAAQLTYHVTEDFFFRGDLGQSTAGRTSFETLGGNIELLTGDERRFTYYSLSLGYNFLPGEVFLGRDIAMNSGFYVWGASAA